MDSRPQFVKNLQEVAEESHYLDQPADHYRSRRRLGKATGAKHIGVNYSRLRPGQLSSKFHFHTHEEEFLFILSGHAVLRYGDTTYQLGPGDAASLRLGGPAHQLRNDFAEDCIYLEIGTREPEDSIIYPEEGVVRKGNVVEPIRT
jgi:uncharacterized cupin superfamily protein